MSYLKPKALAVAIALISIANTSSAADSYEFNWRLKGIGASGSSEAPAGEVVDETAAMCAQESRTLSEPYTVKLTDAGAIYQRPGGGLNPVSIIRSEVISKNYEGEDLVKIESNPQYSWSDLRGTSDGQPIKLFTGHALSYIPTSSINDDHTVVNSSDFVFTGPDSFYLSPSKIERGALIEVVDGVPHYALKFISGYFYERTTLTLSDVLGRSENYAWCVENGYATAN